MNDREHYRYLLFASIMMFLGIILGAFGAHALKDSLSEYSADVYAKANFYHYLSAISIAIMALSKLEQLKTCIYLQLLGGVIFSSSLYLLAISEIKMLGAITPIGGTLMIISWGIFSYKCFKKTAPQ